MSTKKPPGKIAIAFKAASGWFNILLFGVAILSVISEPPDWSSFAIVIGIIVIASLIQFFQDCIGTAAAVRLQAAVSKTVNVRRFQAPDSYGDIVISQMQLAPGDILYVDPGDSIPADCIVLESSALSVSQSR